MKTRIDERAARAFGRLKNQEFQPLVEHLRLMLSDTKDSLIEPLEEPALRRMQGRAQVLKELLEYVDKNDDLVAKVTKR